MKRIWIMIIGAVVFLTSCNETNKNPISSRENEIKKIEVFFRHFNVLSYMPYSEQELTSLADVKLVLMQPRDISLLVSSLPETCVRDYQSSEDKPNLYLMIVYYDSKKQIAIDRFSRFHYKSSLSGEMCKLDQDSRDQITKGIDALQKRTTMQSRN